MFKQNIYTLIGFYHKIHISQIREDTQQAIILAIIFFRNKSRLVEIIPTVYVLWISNSRKVIRILFSIK